MGNKYKSESKKAQREVKKLHKCAKKRAYNTEEAAKTKGQIVYSCPHCKKWHRSSAFNTLVNRLKKR